MIVVRGAVVILLAGLWGIGLNHVLAQTVSSLQDALRRSELTANAEAISSGFRQPMVQLKVVASKAAVFPLVLPKGSQLIPSDKRFSTLVTLEDVTIKSSSTLEIKAFSASYRQASQFPSVTATYQYAIDSVMDKPELIKLLQTIAAQNLADHLSAQLAVWAVLEQQSLDEVIKANEGKLFVSPDDIREAKALMTGSVAFAPALPQSTQVVPTVPVVAATATIVVSSPNINTGTTTSTNLIVILLVASLGLLLLLIIVRSQRSTVPAPPDLGSAAPLPAKPTAPKPEPIVADIPQAVQPTSAKRQKTALNVALRGISGPLQGKVLYTSDWLVISRTAVEQLVIAESVLSTPHLLIDVDDTKNEIKIKDLNSKNGIWVNKQKLKRDWQTLPMESILVIGDVTFTLHKDQLSVLRHGSNKASTPYVYPSKYFLLTREKVSFYKVEAQRDKTVSDAHALFLINPDTGNAEIKDLNSTRGTYINDEKLDNVQSKVLTATDQLKIGNSTLSLLPEVTDAESIEERLHTSKQFGSYRLIEKIGEGGMAFVYAATDRQNRKVAIKTPRSKAANFLERFEREQEICDLLKQPVPDDEPIVPVYAYGTVDGQMYLAMRYIDGCSLADVLEQKLTLLPGIGKSILAPVCRALEFAYGHGVICHRDVTPSNILLDREGRVYLLDFGIAKLKSEGKRLTQYGQRMGTSPYMSPEQKNNPEQVDARSDIYSLGVILYELWGGDMTQNEQGNINIDLSSVRMGGEFQTVLKRCLEVDPNKRYANVQELMRQLPNVTNQNLRDIVKIVKPKKDFSG